MVATSGNPPLPGPWKESPVQGPPAWGLASWKFGSFKVSAGFVSETGVALATWPVLFAYTCSKRASFQRKRRTTTKGQTATQTRNRGGRRDASRGRKLWTLSSCRRQPLLAGTEKRKLSTHLSAGLRAANPRAQAVLTRAAQDHVSVREPAWASAGGARAERTTLTLARDPTARSEPCRMRSAFQ